MSTKEVMVCPQTWALVAIGALAVVTGVSALAVISLWLLVPISGVLGVLAVRLWDFRDSVSIDEEKGLDMSNQLRGYHDLTRAEIGGVHPADLTQAEIGGVHPARPSVVHIAGHHVQIGDHVRQRCGWCGEPLLDYTLNSLVVPDGQTPQLRTWSFGHLVEVTEIRAWQVDLPHRGRLPANACAQLDA